MDEVLFDYAMEPASRGYRKVLPSRARTGIRNFGHNIAYPVRLTSNLLQGEWANAGTETKRFLINTTEGVLGFGDPATKNIKFISRTKISDRPLAAGVGNLQCICTFRFSGLLRARPDQRSGGCAARPASYVYGLHAGIRFNNKTDQVNPRGNCSPRSLIRTP